MGKIEIKSYEPYLPYTQQDVTDMQHRCEMCFGLDIYSEPEAFIDSFMVGKAMAKAFTDEDWMEFGRLDYEWADQSKFKTMVDRKIASFENLPPTLKAKVDCCDYELIRAGILQLFKDVTGESYKGPETRMVIVEGTDNLSLVLSSHDKEWYKK